MSYAIVINLDYENNLEEMCQEIWDTIKRQMLATGFRLDNRVFIINRDADDACELAWQVIENIESHLDFHRKHVFRYLKDFYGYDMSNTTNLLVPGRGEIEVSVEE